jgi:hypothetical protein
MEVVPGSKQIFTNVSVTDSKFVSISPVTSVRDSTPDIIFHLPASLTSYYDLSSSYVHMKL